MPVPERGRTDLSGTVYRTSVKPGTQVSARLLVASNSVSNIVTIEAELNATVIQVDIVLHVFLLVGGRTVHEHAVLGPSLRPRLDLVGNAGGRGVVRFFHNSIIDQNAGFRKGADRTVRFGYPNSRSRKSCIFAVLVGVGECEGPGSESGLAANNHSNHYAA